MLFAICYGLGALSFLLLIALMLMRNAPRNFGARILGVYAVTAIWASAVALHPLVPPGVVHILDAVRVDVWLVFLAVVMIDATRKEGAKISSIYAVIVPIVCILAVLNDIRFVASAAGPADLSPSQVFLRIALAVSGILMVENLYRNTLPAHRWHVVPLCVAAGGLFAYDLFVFSDAVILRHVDTVLLAGRGVVLALAVPPLVVAMTRNQSWNIDIHISRRVVFHTATLTASGIFLIVAAGIAGFIGRLPGDWGGILRLTFLAGSVLALTMALSVEGLRSRVSQFLTENFFSARYDYRTEWMRCIATLSSSGDRDPLETRVIRALADVADSTGGVLWLKSQAGAYRIVQSHNLNLSNVEAETADGAFVKGFENGSVVQVFDRLSDAARPRWVADNPRAWIAIPLVLADQIFGFVVVARSRAPFPLDGEVFELLLTVGRQCASWLSEKMSANVLSESRDLIEYSKRFSFVAHDVKNVSSQLGIMIANMKEFVDQPEFRVDMVRTMEASIMRLNGLIEKLRTDRRDAQQGGSIAVAEIIESVVKDTHNSAISVELSAKSAVCQTIAESDLRSALTHVIANAIEASPPGSPITVSLQDERGWTIIAIEDRGCGMDADFIKTKLFAPLHSTKREGHGVGAFQARELIQAGGGIFNVFSTVGRGTLVRISLPGGARLAKSPVRGGATS